MGTRLTTSQKAGLAGASRWDVPAIGEDTDATPDPEPAPAPDPVAEHLVSAPTPTTAPLYRTGAEVASTAEFTWVGVHGGAGATSLAAATGAGLDLGQTWPEPALGWPRATVLVCRTNTAGFEAAGRYVHEAAAGLVPDLRVIALVAVADSPARLTKPLRRRLHELSSTVPQLLDLGWIPAWREQPYTSHPSATKIADAVSALIHHEGKHQ